MYKFFNTLLFFLPFAGLLAQNAAANDDCTGIIDLGLAPACNNTVYNNIGATSSDIGFGNVPTCFADSVVNGDVWFAFTTSDTAFNYVVTLSGVDQGAGAIISPQIAMYRGECEVNGLAELLCASAEPGASELELNALGLTPNVTYFLRVDHYEGPDGGQAGHFSLCVEEKLPSNTIDQGGTTACSGRLFDSGGEDGNYQSDEDYVFTICPDEAHQCINFTLDYYNIDPSGGDQLIFYEGDVPNFNKIIAQFGGDELEPGGGVCFEVQSASDCLTVRFKSNDQENLEGFAGTWSCSLTPCKIIEPITVEGNISNAQIVDFISTPQTVPEITKIECPPNAYGTFLAGDNTDLGLKRGLLLTTGDINIAPGPNTIVDAGVENDAPGDDDLDYLSTILGEGSLSGDACIVELDVFAATNELVFEYIFASEEYPEFVNTEFNDIFAFFISGPGIVGDPNIGNQLNIAVLPDGSSPVQINSVSQVDNWQYFRNNELGKSLEYDGMTSDFLGVKKSLTARAQVEPCQTYHLKLAIADRRDFAYDSGVFISELRGGAPSFRVAYQSGIDFLIEDCTEISDTLYIELNSPLQDTVSYQVRLEGSATLGTDYSLEIPGIITFLPGQTSFGFPIQAFSDQEEEALETIELSLTNNFGCGEVIYTSLLIELRDQLDVQILEVVDSVLLCQDSTLSLLADGAANYFWTPAGIFENPQEAGQVFTPLNAGWVQVEGRIGNSCVDSDSVYIDLLQVDLEIEALDPTGICQGDSVRLLANNNVGDANLRWYPTGRLSDTLSSTTTAIPDVSSEFIASVEKGGCIIYDSIFIDVDHFGFPQLRSDTTICQNSSIDLILPFDTTGLEVNFSWSPEAGLDQADVHNPLAQPDVSTTYTLFAASKNGGCDESGSVRIDVLPADVEIQQSDTAFICLGSSVELSALTSNDSAANLVWRSRDGSLSTQGTFRITVQPTSPTMYYTNFEVGICNVIDSILVQVDSLPQLLDLMVNEGKDVYCEGETIILTSNVYEPFRYPDIEHRWLLGPGYETSDSLFNMVLTTTDSFLYQRVNINNACADTNSIFIPVLPIPELAIIPADTSVCEGESVQLFARYEGNGTLNWAVPNGLSCSNCPDPIFTPSPGDNIIGLTVDEQGCMTSTTALVSTITPPNVVLTIQANPGDTIFAGEPFDLMVTAEGETFRVYNWTVGDEQVSSGNDTYEGTAPSLAAGQEFGDLPVSLLVRNDDGCTLSTSINLLIVQGLVKIPNTFTPNGDGLNDVFRVFHNTPEISISQFQVYNRWGKLVFESSNNQGWDGRYQGDPAPSEVYLYRIAYRLGRFGEEQIVRGDVTLLR